MIKSLLPCRNLRLLVDLTAELSFYPVTLRLVNYLLGKDPRIMLNVDVISGHPF